MRAKAIVSAIAALSVVFSGLSFAQQDKDVRSDQANREEHRGVEPPRAQDHGRATPPQRNVDPVRHGDGRYRDPLVNGDIGHGDSLSQAHILFPCLGKWL